MQLTIAHDMENLQEAVATMMRAGRRIGLVPTMGALHGGHISLIQEAKRHADAVAVSIFVNPTQFGPNEDFAAYPRQPDADTEKLRAAGADILYMPTPEDMYPAGFSTSIQVGELGNILDGAFRPGHFSGVATVVAKLLLRTLPDVAVFGEKDYQQLCVIRRAVADLDIPVTIIGAPIVREADGLAMSSRNAYLTAEERRIAPRLYDTLARAAHGIAARTKTVHMALGQGVEALTNAGFRVDYLELREEDTLAPMAQLTGQARLLAAAWLGKTRLIDNVTVG